MRVSGELTQAPSSPAAGSDCDSKLGTHSSAVARVPIPFAFRRTGRLTLRRATWQAAGSAGQTSRARPGPRPGRPSGAKTPARSRGPAESNGRRAGRGVWGARSGGAGRRRNRRDPRPPARLTVDVLPIADVLQVAARVLAAQVGVGPAGLQPRVGIPAELGAGRHAARGGVPHGGRPGPGAAPGQQRRRRRGLAMGGPAPLARPGGLSAAEERPRPRDCGRPARLTPPPPWRAPRSRLRFPIGPARRRRPQAVPVQGARPLGTRGGRGTRSGRRRRERGRPWAARTRPTRRRGREPGRGRLRGRWARPTDPALRALRAPPTRLDRAPPTRPRPARCPGSGCAAEERVASHRRGQRGGVARTPRWDKRCVRRSSREAGAAGLLRAEGRGFFLFSFARREAPG